MLFNRELIIRTGNPITVLILYKELICKAVLFQCNLKKVIMLTILLFKIKLLKKLINKMILKWLLRIKKYMSTQIKNLNCKTLKNKNDIYKIIKNTKNFGTIMSLIFKITFKNKIWKSLLRKKVFFRMWNRSINIIILYSIQMPLLVNYLQTNLSTPKPKPLAGTTKSYLLPKLNSWKR